MTITIHLLRVSLDGLCVYLRLV
ncbi:hypothetical protein Golax_023545 [Gossypium laxum]|uniref:Uncharacterized protein n=1 Tax=Gossypium laxum TaxID=34288 RepID=A0A7J8Z993_9ROSI|nr:hypothetical protein [Gossypium laxum]